MHLGTGRKNKVAYVDGQLYMVKKPLRQKNGAVYLMLPKEWVDIHEVQEPVDYLLLDIQQGHIVVKPHHGELELGDM